MSEKIRAALSAYLEKRSVTAIPHDDFTAGYMAGWAAAISICLQLIRLTKRKAPGDAGTSAGHTGKLTISIIQDEGVKGNAVLQ